MASLTADSDSDSEVVEKLGIIQPTVLQQLRKILDEYRNDVQIIKELIQNADDAGATEMKILYQGRLINAENHGEKKTRRHLRAPALVFYNDSVFTDEDWVGIRSIYTTEKARDPLKIGRFGLGFKSVFHMTDYPCIISGDKFMFINPLEHNQDNVCTIVKLNNLRRWKGIDTTDIQNAFGNTFGFSKSILKSAFYKGSMFWFPLRQKTSQVSDIVYSEEEVNVLLESFMTEAERSVLFAKTLCRVEIYFDMPETKNENEAFVELCRMSLGKHDAIYSVEINNESMNLIKTRKDLNEHLIALGRNIPGDSEHWTNDTHITSVRKMKGGQSKRSSSRWFILTYLKGGELPKRTLELLKDDDLCYHHIVGLAVLIRDNFEEEDRKAIGQVFCNQPLPEDSRNLTGLPVHVNAFFALGNNRREVKWEDRFSSSKQSDKAIEWNHVLTSEIFPYGYSCLLQEMIELCRKCGNVEGMVSSVYSIIPDMNGVDDRWVVMARTFLEIVKNTNIVYTLDSKPQWVHINSAALLSCQSFIYTRESCRNTVVKLLSDDGVEVAIMPEKVLHALDSVSADFCRVIPDYICKHLNNHTGYKTFPLKEREDLLQVLTADSRYCRLDSLELLPLADGSFRCFRDKEVTFVEPKEVIELFPGLSFRFLSPNLRSDLRDVIQYIDKKGTYGRFVALDAGHAVKMIREILRGNVEEGEHVEIRGNSWKVWLKGIWMLIQARYLESVDDFKNLKLFPLQFGLDWNTAQNISICSLADLLVYMPEDEDSQEMKCISDAFGLLSVNVVRKLPEWIKPNIVSPYMFTYNSNSLVTILERINTKDVKRFNKKATLEQQSAFLSFLAARQHTDLTEQSIRTLKRLKLFRQYSNEEGNCTTVSIQENQCIYNGEKFPVPFFKPVIRVLSQPEEILAKRLDAKFLDTKQMILDTLQVFGKYRQDDVNMLLLWIVRDPIYVDDKKIKSTIIQKQIAFVECDNGQMKQPSALFDPSDKLLVRLFQLESMLPKRLDKTDILTLKGLQKLGLRCRSDLKPKDIERTCACIKSTMVQDTVISIDKAEALVEVLNQNPKLINVDVMMNVTMIPIRSVQSDNYPTCLLLRNRDSHEQLCCPSEVKSAQYMHLIGSVLFVIDCRNLDALAQKFQWREPPKLRDVVRHLRNVVLSYKTNLKFLYILMVTNIYKWLANYKDREAVKSTLLEQFRGDKSNFIWNGEYFVSPKDIYIESSNGDIDMQPFVFKLPSELQDFADFFICLGCTRHQSFEMYINVLASVKDESENRPGSLNGSSILQIVIAILNKLKEKHLDEIKDTVIYVPIHKVDKENVTLKTTKECIYYEDTDLPGIHDDHELYYIHPNLPLATAEALGVQNIRRHMLSETDAFEEWGQQERLTVRIRNLISGCYVDGFSVIKEMFQNADDAGANDFYVMIDERENNGFRTNLISEGMYGCQGPAVWIYNDAEFTEEDFINIKQLGIGAKINRPEKTGKFGLGFCAVYNITDVPSLLSGVNMIIFDPHTSFLDNALPRKSPGIRIDLSKPKNRTAITNTFSNQFKPYENVFGCKITSKSDQHYSGTLFRLPLRRRESEISDKIYTRSETESLLQKIKELSSNLLIFNQFTKNIKVFHLLDDGTDPSDATLIFDVNARRQFVHRNESFNVVEEVCERMRGQTLERNCLRQLEEVTISTEKYSEGGNIKSCENTVTWLVTWVTGTHRDLLDIAYKSPGTLPLAAVSIPVSICEIPNARYQLLKLHQLPDWFYKSGHYFCFLPVSQKHTFEFHINGKFNISVDRQTLKTRSDDDKSASEAVWNELLISDAVVGAVLYLLENTACSGTDSFQLWPEREHENDTFGKLLVESLYSTITEGMSFSIFHKNGRSFDLSKCVFLDPDVKEDVEIGDVVFQVLQNLCSEIVIDIKRGVHILLCESNKKKIERKTVTMEKILMQYFLPKLHCLPPQVTTEARDRILKYAILMQNIKVCQWLKVHKVIPSDAGDLKYISYLIEPESKVSRLFPRCKGFFPEDGFISTELKVCMKDLGMRSEIISDNMVLEIAKTLQKEHLACFKCMEELSLHLLSYLCEHKQEHKKIYADLQQIAFLPVMMEPDSWPFHWYASVRRNDQSQRQSCERHKHLQEKVMIFEKPTALYIRKYIDLVSCIHLVIDKDLCTDLESTEKIAAADLDELCLCIGLRGTNEKEKYIADVVQQMIAMSSSYDDRDPSINVKATIGHTVESVYNYLEKYSDPKQIYKLQNQEVIWVAGSFVPPRKVSRDDDLEGCEPYLFTYNNTALARCPKLCRALQIREHFQARDVAAALKTVKTEFGDDPVNDRVLQASINLLKFLKNCFDREGVQKVDHFLFDCKEINAIYAPDETAIIRDCSKMCFDDSDIIEKTEKMIYIHENVPRKVAIALGVKSKQLQRLDETSEDVVAFYQHESLVHRLQNLIRDYPLDTGVFKELLQNADDAGASELIFIKDQNTYQGDSILDERSKPLQGPALCVYNDSSFSQADLKGITKLGRGSKYNDPSKIGHFGIGFNNVYNLTDAPSFLTKGHEVENGETICVFDPLVKYIPGVTADKPGKRYKNVDYIRENHTDFLEGYHERKFFRHRRHGTIFRFPLRTESSSIKKEIISMTQLSSLLATFCEELKTVMIFLNNLKCVRVWTCCESAYIEEYSIEISLSELDNQERSKFSETKQSLCEKWKLRDHDFVLNGQQSAEYSITLCEKSLHGKQLRSSFRVIQTIGFDQNKPLHNKIKGEFEKGNIRLMPLGGIAVCENDSGRNESGIAFCSLPLPIGTGLPVHINGHFVLDNENRRALWKSAHLENCHRTHWNLMIIDQVIARSYTLLLKSKTSVLAERFVDNVVSQECVETILKDFFSLFPIHKHSTDFYWKKLSHCVYSEIVKEYLELLPCLEREMIKENQPGDCLHNVKLSWTSVFTRGGHFPAYYSDDNTGIHDPASSLDVILRSTGMRIVSVPKQIRDCFEEINHKIESLAPKRVIKYLISSGGKYNDDCKICTGRSISETGFHTVENVKRVFEYCLQNKSKFAKYLKYLPIMLTQDEILRKLSDTDQLLVTQYADFFPDKRNIFLHYHLVDSVLRVYNSDNETQSDDVRRLKQSLKVFTINDFVDLVDITDLFSKKYAPVVHYTELPSEQFLKSFWKFFKQQLPAFKQNKRVAIVRNALKKLKALPLIPVCTPSLSKKMIIAVSDFDMLLDVRSFQSNTKLQDIVRRFDIVELDKSVFSESDSSDISSYELILEQIPNSLHPGKVLHCFIKNYQEINNVFIEVEEAEIILKYFSDCIQMLSPQDVRSLQKLQIFLTQSGELKSLENFKQIVMVPRNIPQNGLNEIAMKTDCLLLRDIGLVALYEHMGISSTDIEDVYIKVIIPNQKLLTRDQFYVHIDFLCKAVMTRELPVQCKLLQTLKSLPFIDVGSGSGAYVCVQDLFYDEPQESTEDTYESLFDIMCRKDELLPMELRTKYITDVFKTLGLQCNMTLKLFEKFAEKIANDGKVVISEDVRKMSERLFEQLLRFGDHFRKQKKDLQKLSTVKFIVPKRVDRTLTDIHQQLNDSSMISLVNAVIPTKENIHVCWTTSNILPFWLDQREDKNNELALMLGVCQRPSHEELFRHSRNVFQSVHRLILQPAFSTELATGIIKDIYTALGSSGIKKCPDSLNKVPVIFLPDHQTVEKASKIVISCKTTEEIPPYLYEAPSVYSPYKDVFLQLGAFKEPTLDIYVRILTKIKQESKDRVLSQKHLEAALKAMTNVFLLLKNIKSVSPWSSGNLYLLNEELILMNSSALVVCDNRYFYERLKKGINLCYMVRFESLCTKELRMDEIIDCLRKIDKDFRPHLLSEIVDEIVTMSNMEERDPYLAIEVEDFFHNDVFIGNFCRLVRHAFIAAEKPWTAETDDIIVAKFKQMKLKHVFGIQTYLFLGNYGSLSTENEAILDHTQERKTVHVTKDGNNTVVYFESSEVTDWFSEVVEVIALHFNEMFDGILKDELLFVAQRLLQCKGNPSRCQDVLDRKKIDAYFSKDMSEITTVQQSLNPRSEVTAEIPKVQNFCTPKPKPGTFVPKPWHEFLRENYEDSNLSECTQLALKLDNAKTSTFMFVEVRGESELSYEIDIGEGNTIEVDKNRLYNVDNEDLPGEAIVELEHEPYQWHSEGIRWQRQAVADLKDAREALQSDRTTAFNWICYRGHQAAEKSLKAALYATDANKICIYNASHNLKDIAQELTSELSDLAGQMHHVTKSHTRMRYPDTTSGPKIPAEMYSRHDAELVVNLAQEILDFVISRYL